MSGGFFWTVTGSALSLLMSKETHEHWFPGHHAYASPPATSSSSTSSSSAPKLGEQSDIIPGPTPVSTDALDRAKQEIITAQNTLSGYQKILAEEGLTLESFKEHVLLRMDTEGNLLKVIKETKETKDPSTVEALDKKMVDRLNPLIEDLIGKIKAAEHTEDYIKIYKEAEELAGNLQQFLINGKRIIETMPLTGALADFCIAIAAKVVEYKLALPVPLPAVKIGEMVDDKIWAMHAKAFTQLTALINKTIANLKTIIETLDAHIKLLKTAHHDASEPLKKALVEVSTGADKGGEVKLTSTSSSSTAIQKTLAKTGEETVEKKEKKEAKPTYASVVGSISAPRTATGEPVIFGPFGGFATEVELKPREAKATLERALEETLLLRKKF